MNKKKIILSVCSIMGVLILLFIGVIIYNSQVDLYYYNNVNGKDPIKTVKDSIGVELSESVEVVEYQYDKEYGYYDIKIKIQPEDVGALKKNLLVFFESEYTGGFAKGEIPNFENSAEWWDLDYNTVESAYMYWTDKHGPRGSKWEKWTNSIQNWAFISKDKSGEYYLYISSASVIDKYEKKAA